MKNHLNLIYLIFILSVSNSCGSSEKTSDDILRLGGISSTGNKDEQEPEEKRSSDGAAPAMPSLMCENPLDLTNRVYRKDSSHFDKDCGSGNKTNLCIVTLSFVGKSSFVATYVGDSLETPTFVNADYAACESSLRTSIHAPEHITFSGDQSVITDTHLGLSFELVEPIKY